MRVTQYSTNRYGEFSAFEVKPALRMSGVKTAQKIKETQRNDFLGFGVAVTGSSCYNLSRMPADERRAFLEYVYGKDGLGLSVGRLTIGSSDYSAELYSYDDVENDVELTHFSIARDEEYIIPMIKQILSVNPDLKLFASPWSPPGWMKTGGSMCGGYMREEYVGCYARYIAKYLLAYREHGIRIAAVTPQNEAETQQKGRMPACIWHPDIESKFILALRDEFCRQGLDTEIWMYDHNFNGCLRVDWCLSQHPGLKDACDGIAFHYYEGTIEQTAFLKEKYPDLRLHFTEGGPRLFDHYADDWCKWGIMMAKTLNCGYSSFTGWNLMLDETGGPNIGPFFCGGLATRNRELGELSYSGQCKAFRHFSPVISRDCTVTPLEFAPAGDVMSQYPNGKKALVGTAVEKPDGTTVLLLVNPNEEKAQVQYCNGGIWWYMELLPDTVATVVFEK